MAVRSFPADPDFESEAERQFYAALVDQLPSNAVVFPGLRLTDHKEDREADLVVAVPDVGIAVIEVKGGQVAYADGRWTQTGGGGGHTKTIYPVDQARRCRYMLRDYLNRDQGWGHGWPRLAHLVAFPFTSVADDFQAPECPRWMVLGLGDIGTAYERIVTVLRDAHDQPPPPTADQVEDLIECLAGRMTSQRDLLGELAERENACDVMTAHQGKVLDFIKELPRVEVRGGAGAGKTWLAVEKTRRLVAAGQRVGLVCYSRGLATYLQRRVALLKPSERPAYVGTFHGLGVDWLEAPEGADDDSAYWEERLPEAMTSLAAERPVAERFDAFVVDEAQDFAETWWPALLASLRDSEAGGLYVFADEGQRVFARQGRPPVPLVPISLGRVLAQHQADCSDVRELVDGADEVPRRQRRSRCGSSRARLRDAVAVASDEAAALLDAGWPAESVALLTTGSRHPVQVEQQAEGQDVYWESFWANEDLFYGHVLGFKGLERPAVVLCVNGFGSMERAREMLYVGLSRARDLLVVCGDPAVIAEVGGGGVASRLGIA